MVFKRPHRHQNECAMCGVKETGFSKYMQTKMCFFQLSLELSSKILSQCTDDTAQLTRLIKLLTQIRTDLNRRKMCMLQGNANK